LNGNNNEKRMPSPRAAAFEALTRFERSGSWPDKWLEDACRGMEPRDRSLAQAIAMGVLQNGMLIDACIGELSSKPVDKLSRPVRTALRMGFYQLAYMDRIPPSAAVNESVNLVKRHDNPGAVKFANGVLRSAVRKLEAQEPSEEHIHGMKERAFRALVPAGAPEYLLYSHGKWFFEEMSGLIGKDGALELIKSNNAPFPFTARVNTLRCSAEELIKKLEAEGITAELHPHVPDALVFETLKGAAECRCHMDGLFYIQDISAQLAVLALGPEKGDRVLDMCAAPGGKSLMAAMLMGGEGAVTACDLSAPRTELIKKNAKRLGITGIDVQVRDASLPIAAKANKIICDVPCSGTGVIRKKPEIRYKSNESIKELAPLQRDILENAARSLEKGGVMVYSTCSVLKRENEDVVNAFLASHPEMKLIPFELPVTGKTGGMITLYPHIHGGDGFFIAKLGKI